MYSVLPAMAALDVIFAPRLLLQRRRCVLRSSAYSLPFQAPK